MKPRLITILTALFFSLGLILLPSPSKATTPYNCCFCPPVAGMATLPNVMLVMDYSGSMQFRAHYEDAALYWNGYYGSEVATGYLGPPANGSSNCSVSGIYNPTYSYYVAPAAKNLSAPLVINQ